MSRTRNISSSRRVKSCFTVFYHAKIIINLSEFSRYKILNSYNAHTMFIKLYEFNISYLDNS